MTVFFLKTGEFTYHSKITERNAKLILKKKIQRADQLQQKFGHLDRG